MTVVPEGVTLSVANPECHEVFYHITSIERFATLPEMCSACGQSLYFGGVPSVLKFPRISLTQFLTRILSAPGVEELVEKVEERRSRRDHVDEEMRMTIANSPGFPARAAFARIYRERADGEEYRRLQQLLDRRPGRTEGSLSCQLDLYVEW